jgi:2-polyprenyl-3-methyl-5-hydroxy-6-metoxy-1,4-benzoquinol methylase
MRDLNNEFKDSEDRKYAYDFDFILRKYMLRTFAPIFRGTSALEMGCYKGDFTKELQQRFSSVTVIEGSDDLIKAAQKNVPDKNVEFKLGRFEEIEMGKKFDHIFLMHTLEHLDDPRLVLRKIKSWLSDQGRLFLVCPNANAASRQLAVRMGLIDHQSAVTEGEHSHGHRKTYSLDTLEDEARSAGLNIVSRGGVFFKPFANFQFDKLLKTDIIDQKYLDACYDLGMIYPDLSASIYLICGK